MRLRLFLALLLIAMVSVQPASAATPSPIAFHRAALGAGANSNTVFDGNALKLTDSALTGAWTSDAIDPGFAFTRLVASWNADTPGASLVRIEVRPSTSDGAADWYTLGVWASSDHAVQRTSVRAQGDAIADVETDTLVAQGAPFTTYVLRVTLERGADDGASPSVRMLGAQVSNTQFSASAPVSSALSGEPVELAVPSYSQEVHAKHYPQFGGGGEAWCSPTSTQMVIEFWGQGPSADDLAWISPSYADPTIDFAARSTYDSAYRGTGNWPFNTAYAAQYGLDAFVTQLRSLTEAEMFVRAGIPLVASIATRPGELSGFLFDGGTNGHLVVVVGFDGNGNPIVNDPAAWSNATVRRTYDRAQFERVWQRGSAGTVYVIHPPDVPLPAPPPDATPNW
jgi:hypothetical protein